MPVKSSAARPPTGASRRVSERTPMTVARALFDDRASNSPSARDTERMQLRVHVRVSPAAHSNTSTGSPRTSARGTTPRPGAVGAAMRPRTRRGAPAAMLTVT